MKATSQAADTTTVTHTWKWQFDPLDDSGRVQIANEEGTVLAEVATVKSGKYITKRLNAYDELLAILEQAMEAEWKSGTPERPWHKQARTALDKAKQS